MICFYFWISGLQKAVEEGLIHVIEGVSVLVRLVDGIRFGEFDIAFGTGGRGPKHINKKYLPEGVDYGVKTAVGKP